MAKNSSLAWFAAWAWASALLSPSGQRLAFALHESQIGGVAGKTTGADELAVYPQHVRADKDLSNRAVLASETSWLVVQALTGLESLENTVDGWIVGVKLGDVAPDVLCRRIPEHREFRLVCAKDRGPGQPSADQPPRYRRSR